MQQKGLGLKKVALNSNAWAQNCVSSRSMQWDLAALIAFSLIASVYSVHAISTASLSCDRVYKKVDG